MLTSDLCDYSDAYIVVKGRINVAGNNLANRVNKKLTFWNNAPFRSCISKINNIFIDNAENIDIVIPMYNLLEYSKKDSIISETLWNYNGDKVNNSTIENNDANNFRIHNNKTKTCKSFEYRAKLIGSTPDNGGRLDTEIIVPLKYLSNFWRSLDLPLNNCEIELDLSWSRYCVISEISRTSRAVPNTNAVVYQVIAQTTSATFQINNAKVYVSVVTLSINYNIKFLENIKPGFKRTIYWNKYTSEITTQLKNNNLNYLIDRKFRNINRLFVLSFKNGNNNPARGSFDIYYMLLVEIKDFNALIDSKPFFDQPVKKQTRNV